MKIEENSTQVVRKNPCNSRNSPYIKASLTSERLRVQNELLSSKIEWHCCFYCFVFVNFSMNAKEYCEGSNRWKLKTSKVEANWTLPFTQSMSNRWTCFFVWFCTFAKCNHFNLVEKTKLFLNDFLNFIKLKFLYNLANVLQLTVYI